MCVFAYSNMYVNEHDSFTVIVEENLSRGIENSSYMSKHTLVLHWEFLSLQKALNVASVHKRIAL